MAVRGAGSALMVVWAEGTTGVKVVGGPAGGTRGSRNFLRLRGDDDGATAKPGLVAGRMEGQGEKSGIFIEAGGRGKNIYPVTV